MAKRIGRFFWAGLCLPWAVYAAPDPLLDLLAVPGSAGLGLMQRSEQSPYKGAGVIKDVLPVYLYEGERAYLHGTRAGLKLADEGRHRFNVFADYRFEGFPGNPLPPGLAGMHSRRPSTDLGLAYRYHADWGNIDSEFLHDVDNVSKGSEWRLGYHYDWQSGRWHLRPSLQLARRNARLNDYYYGVAADESTPLRPVY